MKEAGGKKRIRIWWSVPVCLICLLFLCWQREYLYRLPFPLTCTFSSPTAVFPGKAGGLYVIDNGKKEILLLDEAYGYTGSIRGGSEKDDFYYASLICDDEQGSIYVSDVVYAKQGTRVGSERILAFDADGGSRRVLYEETYEEGGMPYQYGNILELTEEDGQLSFLLRQEDGVTRVVLDTDGQILEERKWEFSLDLNDAAYDAANDRLIAGTRQGELLEITQDEGQSVQVRQLNRSADGAQELPWSVACRDGAVYYAELLSGVLKRVDETGTADAGSADGILYTVQTGEDGVLYATDYAGVCIFRDGEAQYLYEVPAAAPAMRILAWVAASVCALAALYLAGRLILWMTGRIRDKDRALLVGMVLCASVLVGSIASSLVIKVMLEQQENTTLQELNLFGELLADEVDTQKLGQVRTLGDYKSEAFLSVKEPLDEMISRSYDNGIYYYYILYRGADEQLCGIMDYENTVDTGQPVYEWGDNDYTRAYTEGREAQVYADVSAYGTWSFVLKPVYDENGEVCSVLEVGMNMDDFVEKKNALVLEVIFTVAVSIIVVIMFLMELILLVSNWLRRRRSISSVTEFVPLRTVIFFTYMADSLQDAFIVQLCDRLYQPSQLFPREFMTALPISMELLMAALFALIGGRCAGRIGTRRNLIIGMVLQAAGFMTCALFGTYGAILAGKILVGAGMGFTAVTANALAAMGETEEESGRAFAGINAGILGGITVGDGLGSVLLSFGSYRLVYGAGALIAGMGLLISMAGRDARPEAAVKERGKIQTLAFLRDRRVWPFFLFILIPFMIMIYYREYFFPLYAQDNGVSEIMIGRLFLVCGLIIIYAGPFLGQLLIEKLGGRRAMVLASLLMFADVALFMAFPGFPAAVAGVVGLSVIVSFAYTCQNAYFASLPVVGAYGEGNAMGVYSMMDNIGQTLGPVLFGFVVSLGYTAGIRAAGGIFGILLLLYLLVTVGRKKKV